MSDAPESHDEAPPPAEEPHAVPEENGWKDVLSRAVPAGLGGMLAGIAALLCVGQLLGLVFLRPDEADLSPEQVEQLRLATIFMLVMAPVQIGAIVVGIGVAAGRKWARLAFAGLGLVVTGGQVMAANTGQEPNYFAATVGLACLLVLFSRLDPWFDPEQRERVHGDHRNHPYAALVGWLAGVLAFSTFTVKFKLIFANMGVTLPVVTKLTLRFADLTTSYPYLVLPFVFLAPVALLRLGEEQRKPVAIFIHIIGPIAWLFVISAVLLPIHEMQKALGQ